MSLHINRFIDKLKASDSRGQRDFIMTMSEAKDLHADITKLLLGLHVLHEQTQAKAASMAQTDDIEVEIQGSSF